MKKYCRGYPLRELRQFPDWQETNADTELTDESIVYLWDDLTVVKSPIYPDKGVLWDTVTEAWLRFCQDDLHFEIPEDLRFAYKSSSDQSQTE